MKWNCHFRTTGISLFEFIANSFCRLKAGKIGRKNPASRLNDFLLDVKTLQQHRSTVRQWHIKVSELSPFDISKMSILLTSTEDLTATLIEEIQNLHACVASKWPGISMPFWNYMLFPLQRKSRKLNRWASRNWGIWIWIRDACMAGRQCGFFRQRNPCSSDIHHVSCCTRTWFGKSRWEYVWSLPWSGRALFQNSSNFSNFSKPSQNSFKTFWNIFESIAQKPRCQTVFQFQFSNRFEAHLNLETGEPNARLTRRLNRKRLLPAQTGLK